MSKRRRNKHQSKPVESAPAQQTQQANQPDKRKLAKNTYLAVAITAVLMVSIFVGRWVFAIKDAYFDSFVGRDEAVETAMETFESNKPSEEEAAMLLPLQKEWDLFTSSRLRDEVTVTSHDGIALHGYYFDEGSDVTVVVLHKYNDTGVSDFLPGTWLNETTGCNILMPDARAHGESGGDYTGFGYLEQSDLNCWLSWAEENWGEQTFVIWGIGTGANTALYAADKDLLPNSVALVVAESPYASLHELAKYTMWATFEVPAFPFLAPIEWELAASDAGYTVKDLELADKLAAGSADVPVLFLMSEGDEYVLPEWSRAVYEAYPGEKTLIVGEGSHGTVAAACEEEIRNVLAAHLG